MIGIHIQEHGDGLWGRIIVNGAVIYSIQVVNKGPVDGVYIEGDEPGGGGVREYAWSLRDIEWDREFTGKVTHARADGALVLMEKVLAAIKELKRKDLK